MSSVSNLPPSQEEAYRKKCIELRRRMIEVEENNDATRLRRARLVRGIRKMRIERAILLDSLAKRMRKNGTEGGGLDDEDSEDSTESPPTPQERPLRIKKPHRRLPEMSSPVLGPAPLSATAQTPSNDFPTPAPQSEPQHDPFGPASKFTREELLPPTNLIDSRSKRVQRQSALELFTDHYHPMLSAKPPPDPKDSPLPTEGEVWDSLPNDIRKAWEQAEQVLRATVERSRAAEEWKKTVGNRSRSSGVKPIDLEDDDVVMIGAEEVQR